MERKHHELGVSIGSALSLAAQIAGAIVYGVLAVRTPRDPKTNGGTDNE